jgi:hypothetical protein
MVITIPIENNPGTSAQTVVSIGLRHRVHLYGSEQKSAPFSGLLLRCDAAAEDQLCQPGVRPIGDGIKYASDASDPELRQLRNVWSHEMDIRPLSGKF